MKIKFKALLAAFVLLASMGAVAVSTAGPAAATVAPCSSTYDDLVFSKVNTSHTIRVYRNTGTNSYCGSLNATGALYGVPHHMDVHLYPQCCVNGDHDSGTYAYYAGPVTRDSGDGVTSTGVSILWQYETQGGNMIAGGAENIH